MSMAQIIGVPSLCDDTTCYNQIFLKVFLKSLYLSLIDKKSPNQMMSRAGIHEGS